MKTLMEFRSVLEQALRKDPKACSFVVALDPSPAVVGTLGRFFEIPIEFFASHAASAGIFCSYPEHDGQVSRAPDPAAIFWRHTTLDNDITPTDYFAAIDWQQAGKIPYEGNHGQNIGDGSQWYSYDWRWSTSFSPLHKSLHVYLSTWERPWRIFGEYYRAALASSFMPYEFVKPLVEDGNNISIPSMSFIPAYWSDPYPPPLPRTDTRLLGRYVREICAIDEGYGIVVNERLSIFRRLEGKIPCGMWQIFIAWTEFILHDHRTDD